MATRTQTLITILASLLVSLQLSADIFKIPSGGLKSALQPQVAVDSSGKTYVVFGEKESGSIFCSTAENIERGFSEPVRVAALPKLALGMRRGPRISVAKQGITVAAISHEDGNLYTWFSSDSGKSWTASDPVNTAKRSAGEGLHDLASNADGKTFVTWLDHRNKGTELWGALSENGGKTWGKDFLVYASPDGHICECCHPTAQVDAKGKLWVMWRNWKDGARDMWLASSDNNGKNFRPEKLGQGTWNLNACPMDGGDFAFTSSGELLSVWRREARLYSASPLQTEQLVSSTGKVPVIEWLNEQIILWHDGQNVLVKKGDSPAKTLSPTGGYPVVAKIRNTAVALWENTKSKTIEGTLIP
jgi:hypothetical protein